MQYRKFGNTDLMVSGIGFGAWAIGGGAMLGKTAIGWGDADDTTSLKAIQAALDAGINFFDTADIYGLGHSEELLGKALKNKDVIIATKVGNVARNNQFTVDYAKEYMLKACEESLKRLNRETIDYYQLHTARLHHLQQGDCIEVMEQLKQQGKIRYWGISLNTFNPEPEAAFFMQNQIGSGFQLVLNIMNQKALNLIKEACKNGYGIIARMPLQFGLLTGKFTRNTTFSENDHRHLRLNAEALDRFLTILEEKVWPIAGKENVSKTELALSFLLSIKEISTVIPGLRTPDHVKQNTSGLKQLSPETMQELFSLGKNDMQPLLQLMQQIG